MKKHKKILYIGNNLKGKTKNPTMLETLCNLLRSENFTVYTSSNKTSKIIRLLDMCMAVMYYRNKVDYILIDTYSTTNFYYTLFISQLARIFNVRYIPILHGGNLPFRIKKSRWFSNLIFKNAHKNIAPSNYLKHEFESQGYTTTFIPNIIEIEKYTFKKRNKLKPKILWVRAFKTIYNPTLAIEVLYLLKKEYDNATLCMIGPFVDDSYKDCKVLVKKYNLEDSVEFTGVLSKEEWHKKSKDFDIFINTTNFDNTPVSVIEAMALGLPIVSTNVGGVPFLINNKENGILVEKENPAQMAHAIIDIINNRYLNLAISARKKVEDFDWDFVKHKWLEILE